MGTSPRCGGTRRLDAQRPVVATRGQDALVEQAAVVGVDAQDQPCHEVGAATSQRMGATDGRRCGRIEAHQRGHAMVRYADGPTAIVERVVNAPSTVLWELVTDISLPARFSTEFQGAEWLDEGPAAGARFRGHNSHEVVGDWSVVCTVTALEHERTFEWTVGPLDDRAACWRFDLEPSDDGVVLRFTAVMGPGPSGLTPAIEAMPEKEEAIVQRRLREWTTNMQRTVDGIAALAETA